MIEFFKKTCCLHLLFICITASGFAAPITQSLEVGVARIDITPTTPIRLAGFGVRVKSPSEGVLLNLNAKAIAFGSNKQQPSIIITVDLIGIPSSITKEVVKRLEKAGISEANLAICASHTHSGPEIGTLLNILQYRTNEVFSDSLIPKEQIQNIAAYINELPNKLEKVALDALKNRKPALLSWGNGGVDFARNRRVVGGPVDHDMPLLKVTDLTGKLKAVFLNYACHAVAMGGGTNKIHGDWVGEAQRLIEQSHPGVTALIAVGCGADADPYREKNEKTLTALDFTIRCAQKIADETSRMLTKQLKPVTKVPVGKIKKIDLPFDSVPGIEDLVEFSNQGQVKAYYARQALEQIARGEPLPHALKDFPIQVWSFGTDLTMVFYGGETLSTYALRLKKELGRDKLWINGYTNDVACYIAPEAALGDSRYIYETTNSMYYYNKPSPFAKGIEDKIINTVYKLLPAYLLKNR